jgi:hypothetical protein
MSPRVRAPTRAAARARADAGQASVELVALLPLLAVLALAAWQAVAAGWAAWLTGGAARAAARAAAVGGDPAAAASAALPPALERDLRVTRRGGGSVTVRVTVRSVVGDVRLATLTRRSAFPDQGAR